jgi:hypothetical protein
MVITLVPELDAALKEQARRQGIAPEELALNALKERFLGPALSIQPQDEWERRLLSAATDCGTSLTHEAVSSEGIYE